MLFKISLLYKILFLGIGCLTIQINSAQNIETLNNNIKIYSLNEAFVKKVEYTGTIIDDSKNEFEIYFNELTDVSDIKVEYGLFGKKKKALKEKEIRLTAVSTSSFYANYKAYFFKLPLLSNFSYSYQAIVQDPMMLSSLELCSDKKTKKYTYSIEIPSGLTLKFDSIPKLFRGAIQFDSLFNPNNTVYSVTIKPDYSSISENKYMSLRLVIYPKTLKGGGDEQLNNWYKNLLSQVKPLDTLTKSIARNINLHFKGDKLLVLDSIFKFVQFSISYIDIENGINAFRPRPPDNIIKNKKGDCKDMGYLLYSMLNEVGIESYMALSSTIGHNYDLDFPSLNSANHAICVTYINNKIYYLDATEDACLLGRPSTQIQNRNIFICKDQGVVLHVPAVEANINYSLVKMALNLEDKKLKGSFNETRKGMAAIDGLSYRKALSGTKFNYILKKILTDKNRAFNFDSIQYNQEKSAHTQQISYTAKCHSKGQVVTSVGNNSYLDFSFLPHNDFESVLDELYEDSTIRISNTFKNEYQVIINFDKEIEFETPVKIQFDDNKNFWFHFDIQQLSNRSLLINYIFYCNSTFFNRAETTKFIKLQNKIYQHAVFSKTLKYNVKN